MSDNQQRAAEVLGFRELAQAKRFARDDLERITAALDEAETRGRAEVAAELDHAQAKVERVQELMEDCIASYPLGLIRLQIVGRELRRALDGDQ